MIVIGKNKNKNAFSCIQIAYINIFRNLECLWKADHRKSRSREFVWSLKLRQTRQCGAHPLAHPPYQLAPIAGPPGHYPLTIGPWEQVWKERGHG